MTGPKIWLCLSGGNALGAYHAGVYQALHELGVRPHRIAGASIGAITGALIAGNLPDQRLEALQEFWRRAGDDSFMMPGVPSQHQSVMRALLSGRPRLFQPKFSAIAALFSYASTDSLFDTAPQRRTLIELIDFDLLNNCEIPFLMTALDAESGDDVVFHNRSDGLTVDHLMAGTALPIAFPPVRVDGRTLIDPGLSANLPVRAMFDAELTDEVLCICVDLLPAAGQAGKYIEDMVGRATDLLFASQSRHALTDIHQRYSHGDHPGLSIIYLVYRQQQDEIGLKAFEFSRRSVTSRWEHGYRDGLGIVGAMESMPPRRTRADIWAFSEEGLQLHPLRRRAADNLAQVPFLSR